VDLQKEVNIRMECIVEIICIGNELLIGKISNTNAQWLAKHITALGGNVRRINVVGDNLDEISSVLKSSLSREPFLIITTGGLGPTFDDMTLKAIGNALKSPLSVNEEALKMVKEKYHRREVSTGTRIELTSERIKMAILPRGAKPLINPIGTAPGVQLTTRESKIIMLPGVPAEMESIFDTTVEAIIRGAVGDVFVYDKSLYVTEIMESTIAPLIDETIHDNPLVYIKSHPKMSEVHPVIELHLLTTSKSKNEAEERINAAAEKISSLILEQCGKVDIELK
jgi:nicotinamide-nucleotide amidase